MPEARARERAEAELVALAASAVAPARRRGSLLGLIAGGAIVLGLLSVFAIELSNSQETSRRDVAARVHERSVLAAALIDSLLATTEQALPADEARYGGPRISASALDAARGQNLYAVLLDSSGSVLAASSGFTAQARRDLRISAALALVRRGHPYALGNVLPYGRSGVINLAVAFPTPYGRRFLLTGSRPQGLSPFLNGELRQIPGVPGSRNYVIDGGFTVLGSTNRLRPPGYRFSSPAQIEGLRQPRGEYHGFYYDEAPITNSTWRIVLAAPASRLFASVSGLRKWLPWLIFTAFALVAAAALLLGSRLLLSAESDLRDANLELQTVNRQLEEANEALAHDALHDPLTGLPNRVLFTDRLDHALRRSGRDASGCAVLFIDLDGFKLVNDSLSHAVGDQLLIAVAQRFRELLRPGDTVARLGGDEFALLLDGVAGSEEAVTVAHRVNAALSHPFEVGAHRLHVRASVGIAVHSGGGSPDELLGNADIAMYDAKRRGSTGFAIFDETMRQRVVARLAVENRLRDALAQSRIGVLYQPVIDLGTGAVTGLEALPRWSVDGRLLDPGEFVPVAEEAGLAPALGREVLRAALEDFGTWRRGAVVTEETYLSVSVSRRQLDDLTLPGEILGTLASSGVPADRLRLEITEATLVQEPHRMRRIAAEVCAHGVGLHLDEFGTQYSSLSALMQFPVEALKIDRSLITSVIGTSAASQTIVGAIVTLAHNLGLRAIAEGLQDGKQLARVSALGCDLGQGSLFFPHPLERAEVAQGLSGFTAPAGVRPQP